MPYESPSSGARWLEEQWLELRQFTFEWVAAGATGLIDHRPDLSTVLESLPADDDDMALAYVDGQEFEAGDDRLGLR
jgi:hypothetical protein